VRRSARKAQICRVKFTLQLQYLQQNKTKVQFAAVTKLKCCNKNVR
jgi:hypothetical protein